MQRGANARRKGEGRLTRLARSGEAATWGKGFQTASREAVYGQFIIVRSATLVFGGVVFVRGLAREALNRHALLTR